MAGFFFECLTVQFSPQAIKRCPGIKGHGFLICINMLKAAKTSVTTMKRSIVRFAILNAAIFILLALAFKCLNLLHIWGLNMINYVILTFISLWQVHRWIKQSHGYIPFLEVFFTVIFTGALAFVFFGIFIFLYSLYDPYLASLYITHSDSAGKLIAPILLFFEGSGGSIIVAMIAAFYAARFEDGEASA